MAFSLKTCDGCKVRFRRTHRHKGKLYCYRCYRKKLHIIYLPAPKIFTPLRKALTQTYDVYTYMTKNTRTKQPVCRINVPAALSGRKVKLVLVDDSSIGSKGVKNGHCN